MPLFIIELKIYVLHKIILYYIIQVRTYAL